MGEIDRWDGELVNGNELTNKLYYCPLELNRSSHSDGTVADEGAVYTASETPEGLATPCSDYSSLHLDISCPPRDGMAWRWLMQNKKKTSNIFAWDLMLNKINTLRK